MFHVCYNNYNFCEADRCSVSPAKFRSKREEREKLSENRNGTSISGVSKYISDNNNNSRPRTFQSVRQRGNELINGKTIKIEWFSCAGRIHASRWICIAGFVCGCGSWVCVCHSNAMTDIRWTTNASVNTLKLCGLVFWSLIDRYAFDWYTRARAPFYCRAWVSIIYRTTVSRVRVISFFAIRSASNKRLRESIKYLA